MGWAGGAQILFPLGGLGPMLRQVFDNFRVTDQFCDNFSLTFGQIKELSKAVFFIHKSRGIRNEVMEKEKEIRSWARRVIVATKQVKKGEFFTEDNITTLRAGNGLSSKYFFEVLNKTSKVNIDKGSKLKDSFF